MFGVGAQFGYRLTEYDSISLSYDFDGFTRYDANWFGGLAYQLVFRDNFFVQTGIGVLTSRWLNSNANDWEEGKYSGPAINVIIGGERLSPSGVMIGADFIGGLSLSS